MKILVISTWFPYPLSQGSKIRAYNIIKALSRQHEVYLISFVDTPVQPGAVDHMKQFCHWIELVDQNPFYIPRLHRLIGWFSLLPSSIASGYSKQMSTKVRELVSTWEPNTVLALTFVTAQYAIETKNVTRVIDIDNYLTPFLHEEYLNSSGTLQSLRRWVAWKKFARYEKRLFRQFDRSLVVSSKDYQAIQFTHNLKQNQVIVIPNGVDTENSTLSESEPVKNTLIYNGSLSYKPNHDAMQYFLKLIFPLIRSQVPDALLWITGKADPDSIQSLPFDEHVTITGFLDDVRPLVARSWVCVVPLRQGAGTRIKVLEAMALGTPVVSTTKGIEGIDVIPGKHVLIADQPEVFARQTIRLLQDSSLREMIAIEARQLVREKYSWSVIGDDLNLALTSLD
jgi:glycosyltransferase involved in cell wall biosynthesis